MRDVIVLLEPRDVTDNVTGENETLFLHRGVRGTLKEGIEAAHAYMHVTMQRDIALHRARGFSATYVSEGDYTVLDKPLDDQTGFHFALIRRDLDGGLTPTVIQYLLIQCVPVTEAEGYV
jgi:hypothetical protein